MFKRAARHHKFLFLKKRTITSKSLPQQSKQNAPDKDIIDQLKHALPRARDLEQSKGIAHKIIDRYLPWTPRHQLFEPVVAFLLDTRHPDVAGSVFQRMHAEGLHLSDAVEAKMVAITLTTPFENREALFAHLKAIFEKETYTEDQFSDLVKVLVTYRMDEEVLGDLVDLFVGGRGEGYTPRGDILALMLRRQVKAGNLEEAFAALESNVSRASRSRVARGSVIEPFAAVISAIVETDINDDMSLKRVLVLLEQSGQVPDIAIFNILLSREVRLGHTLNALNIFKLVQQKQQPGTEGVFPDSFTFGSMFTLYRRKKARSKRQHASENVMRFLSSRHLFQQMWVAVEAGHVKPSKALLNVALRAFVRQGDFAAVYVALNSFAARNVPLDHRTYYSIFKLVVRRVWFDIQTHGNVDNWTTRFLGLKRGEQVVLDADLVDNILYLISRAKFDVLAPLYQPGLVFTERGAHYPVPSLEMMESVEPPDPDFKYEILPLRRLLERAIFAGLPADTERPLERVSANISAAEREMLPEGKV